MPPLAPAHWDAVVCPECRTSRVVRLCRHADLPMSVLVMSARQSVVRPVNCCQLNGAGSRPGRWDPRRAPRPSLATCGCSSEAKHGACPGLCAPFIAAGSTSSHSRWSSSTCRVAPSSSCAAGVPHVAQEFTFTEHDGATPLEYSGKQGTDFRWPPGSGMGKVATTSWSCVPGLCPDVPCQDPTIAWRRWREATAQRN